MNEIVGVPGWAITMGGYVLSGLFGLTAWLAQRQINGLQAQLTEFDEKIEAEREGRENDRHDLRDEIGAVSVRLNAFELTVAKECINHERLREAMRPLTEQMSGMRSDVKEIFGKLDGKQDKPRGGD
jgi:chromosome segregation ATPase